MSMRPKPRRLRAVTAFTLGLAVVAAASAVSGALATQPSAATGVGVSQPFSSGPIVPGRSVSGGFSVQSQADAFVPWVRVIELDEGCLSSTACSSVSPPLSRVLQVSITAPDGMRTTSTLARLATGMRLPGGTVSALSRPVRYQASMRLPRGTGNQYQRRRCSFAVEYGPAAEVLGEAIHRGGTHEGNGPPAVSGGLPFTGAATFDELVAGGLLIGSGLLVLFAVRRRHSPDDF
jgi:hypothetical protein